MMAGQNVADGTQGFENYDALHPRVQLQRDVRPLQLVQRLATNEIRPPMMAAVN